MIAALRDRGRLKREERVVRSERRWRSAASFAEV